MTRIWVVTTGVLGALGVGLGAFGAHGLERMLEGADDAARRLEWWHTAVDYHLVHALALAVAAWVGTQATGRAANVAGGLFLAGIAVFSGTLYAMTLGAPRFLGAVTPIGGVALILGWLTLAWSAHGLRVNLAASSEQAR